MDVDRVRRDFPILFAENPRGPLVYLDSACTSLRPQPVIDATLEYYRDYPVCGGRSIHRLAETVSGRVEVARRRTAAFLGAKGPETIVFTKNTTESINMVAQGLGLRRGDVVVTTDKEHNSNWVPWLRLRDRVGIRVLTLPSTSEGEIDEARLEDVSKEAGDRLRLVSVAHSSNADGVVAPVPMLTKWAHERGARILLDSAQYVPHHPVDVAALGIDFLAASAHKMVGPSGLGFLYGTEEALAGLEPLTLGGGTVDRSTETGYTLLEGPQRFEAGLQNYAALWAWPAAMDYLDRVGRDWIAQREQDLNAYASKRLEEFPAVTIHGPEPRLRSGILPFTVAGVDSHDVALFLDEKRNIAIRSGAHCVNAYFARQGLTGWARASFYLYNNRAEVDAFVEALAPLAKGVREKTPKPLSR